MPPLAQRLRPRSLDDVCGQRHLLAPGQVFRRTVQTIVYLPHFLSWVILIE